MVLQKMFFLAAFFGLLSSITAQDQVSHVWTRTLGGSSHVYILGVAYDPSGNVIVSGWFGGTVDFDPGLGIDNRVSQGSADIFVSKFSAQGVHLWTNTVGGTASDQPVALAVDHEGNICIAGWFDDTVDFDPSEDGVDIHTSVGGTDIFTSKYAPDGGYLWTIAVGNDSQDFFGENLATGLAFDSLGNVFVVGSFIDFVDFDPSEDGVDVHFANTLTKGARNTFITKYSSAGEYLWALSFQFALSSSCRASQVAVDSQDDVVVAGSFRNMIDFNPNDPGEDWHSSADPVVEDAYVCKIRSDGSFLWARSIRGSSKATDVAVDSLTNVFLVGYYYGTVDFDPSEEGEDLDSSNGSQDCFISKFSPEGNYEWSHRFGGSGADLPNSVILDSEGSVIAAGDFRASVDFNPDHGGDLQAVPNQGVFLTKLNSFGMYEGTHTTGAGASSVHLNSIDKNDADQIVYGGSFQGSMDFDLSDDCAQTLGSISPVRVSGFLSTFFEGANSIQSSAPANNSIDARQPSDLSGIQQFGTQQIVLDFAGSVSCVGVDEFSIQEESGDGVVPSVSGLLVNGEFGVILTLNTPIEPGAWTTITHNPSGSSVRLGYLPGDVNGDKTSSPVDILSLINSLNGVIPRPLHATDMDRSGVANPADILRLIDLLNGAGAFDPWNGQVLP